MGGIFDKPTKSLHYVSLFDSLHHTLRPSLTVRILMKAKRNRVLCFVYRMDRVHFLLILAFVGVNMKSEVL